MTISWEATPVFSNIFIPPYSWLIFIPARILSPTGPDLRSSSCLRYSCLRCSKSAGTKRSKRVATALALNENAFVESKGFTFNPEKFVRATPLEVTTRSSPRILCWSGCKEEEYSYGGNNGGTLTISVIRSWTEGISYDSLWDKAYQGVNKSQPTQHPVVTSIGNFQTSAEAFK